MARGTPRFTELAAASDFAASSVAEDGGDVSLLPALAFACLLSQAAIPATLKTSQSGGTATVCGISEYAFPSTPPKKYRTQTLSGSMTGCIYVTACAHPANGGGYAQNWTGQFKYSATTCGTTNTQLETVFGSNGDPTCGASLTPLFVNSEGQTFSPGSAFGAPAQTNVSLPQTNAFNWIGTCTGPGGAPPNAIQNGQCLWTLSDEDLDADAIARLIAANPFPAFVTCATPPTCALAGYQQRTGFSFQYQACKFEITATGLVPNQRYCGQIEIWRRPYGVGSFVLFEKRTYNSDSDGAGNLTIDDNVPNDIGFESYATNAVYGPAY